jgi:hypothetical protein
LKLYLKHEIPNKHSARPLQEFDAIISSRVYIVIIASISSSLNSLDISRGIDLESLSRPPLDCAALIRGAAIPVLYYKVRTGGICITYDIEVGHYSCAGKTSRINSLVPRNVLCDAFCIGIVKLKRLTGEHRVCIV